MYIHVCLSELSGNAGLLVIPGAYTGQSGGGGRRGILGVVGYSEWVVVKTLRKHAYVKYCNISRLQNR